MSIMINREKKEEIKRIVMNESTILQMIAGYWKNSEGWNNTLVYENNGTIWCSYWPLSMTPSESAHNAYRDFLFGLGCYPKENEIANLKQDLLTECH